MKILYEFESQLMVSLETVDFWENKRSDLDEEVEYDQLSGQLHIKDENRQKFHNCIFIISFMTPQKHTGGLIPAENRNFKLREERIKNEQFLYYRGNDSLIFKYPLDGLARQTRVSERGLYNCNCIFVKATKIHEVSFASMHYNLEAYNELSDTFRAATVGHREKFVVFKFNLINDFFCFIKNEFVRSFVCMACSSTFSFLLIAPILNVILFIILLIFEELGFFRIGNDKYVNNVPDPEKYESAFNIIKVLGNMFVLAFIGNHILTTSFTKVNAHNYFVSPMSFNILKELFGIDTFLKLYPETIAMSLCQRKRFSMLFYLLLSQIPIISNLLCSYAPCFIIDVCFISVLSGMQYMYDDLRDFIIRKFFCIKYRHMA